MRLSSIALRSLRRHSGRSVLLVLVIVAAVAVVTALYLVSASAERDLSDRVDEYGANIVVAPRSKELPLTYGGVSLGGLTYDVEPLRMEDLAKIRAIPDGQSINKIAPKLVEPVTVDGVRLLAVGVDWGQELGLKKWWRLSGTTPGAATDVLLGSRAAERLGRKAGDTVSLGGERFTVAATLVSTGTQEDDLLYLDLGTAQRLWQRPGEVSFVEVSAWCSSCPIDQINAEIASAIPTARVSALLKAVESRRLLIDQFRLFSWVLSALMVVVGCLIVLASTLGAVRERRGEIGIFRSIGYRRRHVLEVILLENLTLALVAGLLGVGLAVLAAGPLARRVAGVVGPVAASPGRLVVALFLSVLVVLLASLYPAWQASRLSPTLAMRRV